MNRSVGGIKVLEFTGATGWTPKRSVEMILEEVLDWLGRHRAAVEPVLE